MNKKSIVEDILKQMKQFRLDELTDNEYDSLANLMYQIVEKVELIETASTQQAIDDQAKELRQLLPQLRQYDGKYQPFNLHELYEAFVGDCLLILDSKTIVDEQSRIRYTKDSTGEETVNHIVQKVRFDIDSHYTEDRERGTYYPETFYQQEKTLKGQSGNSSGRVLLLCSRMGLKAKIYDTADLFNNARAENQFSIVEINGEKYIIDCSYNQFFSALTISGYSDDPEISKVMLADEKKSEFARHLLKYGWVKATSENIKLYLDGFAKEKNYSADEYLGLLESANTINEDEIYNYWPRFRGRKNTFFPEEESYKNKFLIDSKPVTDGLGEEEFDDRWSDEQKLDALVRRERLRISRMVDGTGDPYDIENDSLKLDCVGSSEKIYDDCKEKNIKANVVYSSDVYYEMADHLSHHFCIVTLDEKKYLVDCTYRQFFITSENERKSSKHYPRKIYGD